MCREVEGAEFLLLHVFYLDPLGTEQRISMSFTQKADRIRRVLDHLRHLVAQAVHGTGGQVLTMQLEVANSSELLRRPVEQAQILPWPGGQRGGNAA